MKMMRMALAAAMLLGLVAVAGAQDKDGDLAKKIMGKWEAVKGKGLPEGATIEFKKDGKLTIVVKRDDKEIKLDATYKVKGKTFEMTMKRGDEDRTQTITVTKITGKEMETEGPKGEPLSFKRVGGEKKKKKAE